jgi:hypothetical protein
MKIALHWILLCILFPGTLWATEPEAIEPKTKIMQTRDWYQQQAQLWENTLKQQPRQAQAWLNYYLAARYADYAPADLQNSISEMAKTCPQSFEYQYIRFKQGNGDPKYVSFLEKAYTLQPDNPLTYGDFIVHYEQAGNQSEKIRFCQKWLQSNDLSHGLLSYGYNLLMSASPDGILLTAGEATTLPVWVVQHALNVRPDVLVLDLDLLSEPTYRKRLLAAHKLTYQESVFNGLSASQIRERLGNHLFEQNPGKSFYFALSLPWPVLQPMQEQLYVGGLASQLSTKRLNNIEQLKDNLENRYLLDYLRIEFAATNPQSTARVFKTHYLAAILLLQAHYQQNGEETKANKWRQLALQLAKDRAKTDEVLSYLEQNKIVSTPMAKPSPSVLAPEPLEKSLRPVFNKLLAQQAEVTNAEYQKFLDYLQQNNRQADYEKYKPDLSAYEGVGETFMRNYHTPYRSEVKKLSETAKERSYINHPVLNIPYEAATAYCTWLTDQYNRRPDRKYKTVKFRLPNLNEWRIAAIGANQFKGEPVFENLQLTYKPRKEKTLKEITLAEVRYPWWRVVPQLPYNEYGCYLSNFRVDSSRCGTPFGDGFGFTGPVTSYFANDIGLYDMVGNVAEMISEKGKACGGSWNHPPEESTITSVMTYDKPDSRVGFRVFMEIVEEKK